MNVNILLLFLLLGVLACTNNKLIEYNVKDIFEKVASEKYDLMNDIMSFGVHRLWKKYILVELAGVSQKDIVLDIASGTGDIAKLISQDYPDTEIYMTDINMDMLVEGRLCRKNALQKKLFSGYFLYVWCT